MTLFIGDVHGKYAKYKQIIRNHRDTIQVGDIGIGFFHPSLEDSDGKPKALENPPHKQMLEGNHRFIRGNHDNPGVCKKNSQWIPDGTIEGDVMFIGGATSIDKELRIIYRTWWPDEELNRNELEQMVDIYRHMRPRVMVTHECPNWVAEAMGFNTLKFGLPSATRQAFQIMSEYHQPDIWIFGHWHHSFDKELRGTRYVCLAECEAKEIKVL